MTASEAFTILEMTVRGHRNLQILASSTPKRGGLVGELSKRDECRVIRGSMRDNIDNLSTRFVETMFGKYGGTRLGRQELEGELIDTVEGALVTPAMIDACRVKEVPPLQRIVVGVDPSGSMGGDRQGIVVCGRGADGHAYILADRSCSHRPEGWGRRAVEAMLEFDADCIVVERNYGGDMAKAVITQAAREIANAPVRILEVTASRAKHVRFEPVSLLIEQGRVHFVRSIPRVEDQFCSFTADGYDGDGSPDEADAAIWALTKLMPAQGISPSDLYGSASVAGSA